MLLVGGKVLLDRFVKHDSRTHGQVEAAPLFGHRDRNAALGVCFKQLGRDPCRLAAEEEEVTLFECGFEIGALTLRRRIKTADIARLRGEERLQTLPYLQIELVLVVQTGTTDRLFGDIKPQWFYQVQGRTGIDADAADGSGVVGNLGVDENDVKH